MTTSRSHRSSGPNRTAYSQRRPRHRTLSLETMERRELMAARLSLYDGLLTISADTNGSQVSVIDHNPSNSSRGPHLLTVVATSGDGTVAQAFSKHSVNSIEFHGSSQRDVYQAPTGLTPINVPIRQTVRGWGGNDYLVTGLGNDTIHGFFGNDTIHSGGGNDIVDAGPDDDDVSAGYGNDSIDGSFGRDRLFGEQGHDTLRGASGYDDLYGGPDNDLLLGGSDPDLLEGGDGNDQLFGESGNDFLYGEAGQDGLYGGGGADLLHGGGGADRFLFKTTESGPFTQTFGGTSIGILDQILDDTDQDIRIRLTDEAARTVFWPAGYSPSSTSFAAGSWSDTDVALVDDALEIMATATGSNALLYKANGSEPILYRLGNASNRYIAFNDGDTHYSNQSFELSGVRNDNWMVQVVLHEFGHNWDTPDEANTLTSWGGLAVNTFRDKSGWTQTLPAGATNYVRSGDGQWWYRNDAAFVRDYARMNPFEDFAESFSAYFMDVAGRPFQLGPGAAAAATKMGVMGGWTTIVSWLGPAGRPTGAGGSASAAASATQAIPQPATRDSLAPHTAVAHHAALSSWGQDLEDQLSRVTPVDYRSGMTSDGLSSRDLLTGILFPVFRPRSAWGR